MEKNLSAAILVENEIIYKNDKPYIILALKEYEKLIHSSKKIHSTKAKKEFIKMNNVTLVRNGKGITGKELSKLKLAGIWEDRKEISDSVQFVQNLRKNTTRKNIKELMKNF